MSIPTSARVIDRLILGDNQFFGINHMSEEKARTQEMRFQDTSAIVDVLDAAYAHGLTSFMCTTHERVAEICDHVRAEPMRYTHLSFLPCMPYAHKYANAVTQDGFLGAIRRYMPSDGLIDSVTRGTKSLTGKDIEGIATLLIDAEMAMFSGLPTPVIFMQNVLVDLLLGLGFVDAFGVFASHVRSRYGAEPGFITMNLPRLIPVLAEVGIDNPIVCFNLNKLGFRMSGGVAAYAKVMAEHHFRAVAMSVFASGAIPAGEAVEWVCGQPNLESIVFGASTGENIVCTRDLVDKFWRYPTTTFAASPVGASQRSR